MVDLIRGSEGIMPKKISRVHPFLKWAGGKRALLPELRQHLPKDFADRNYFEPFVGAGALFFDQQPSKAVIGDANKDLILTYIQIRDNVETLISELKEHERFNKAEYFYEIRELDRNSSEFTRMSDVKKAARLIYLNRTCFNGLYRVNSQGLFNVPFGYYKNPKICDEKLLQAVHRYLAQDGVSVDIVSGDYESTVKKADHTSFVYFDPPYYSPDNTNFVGYQANGFSEKDHERLKKLYVTLTERGTKCLLSNSDSDFIRSLYKDKQFEIISLRTRRMINCIAEKRGEVGEVLVKNWK
ncbi:MAG: DNA adenine methylase [Bifidobacteriaceae bacterium]|jgi:DNA adenine methylase|nr:DNA adenine methylase [Bifidobacteriaceae bacterium]